MGSTRAHVRGAPCDACRGPAVRHRVASDSTLAYEETYAAAATLSLTLSSSADAHHSHFYDECKSIAIEGRVERVEFKNPHNLFVLRLDDGTAYDIHWVNVTRLTSAGIIGAAKDAVGPGVR